MTLIECSKNDEERTLDCPLRFTVGYERDGSSKMKMMNAEDKAEMKSYMVQALVKTIEMLWREEKFVHESEISYHAIVMAAKDALRYKK